MVKASLEDQFKHQRINEAFFTYAKELLDIIGDDEYSQTVLNLIRQARMICNQIVSRQDLVNNI